MIRGHERMVDTCMNKKENRNMSRVVRTSIGTVT